ncbi:PREDICTED: transcription repressor OFP12-like [Tarenaya hassleriana]|uniref:transcription repressor OFP12-like n=1 Tax=Tarenaya hassleriana TaxID=28532 RepID=UPI00053C9603|nr:PREDICTED: transcription repressor OFP12-like [Tarenaya hassleriana]
MRNLVPCFAFIKRSTFPDSSPVDLSRPFRSRPVFQNFNSLFIDHNTFSEPEPDPVPDFSALIASQRFFFSSPGRSNSIVESCPSISTGSSSLVSPSPSDRLSTAMDGGDESSSDSVAVQTDSPDPYADFRRSMEEMVEARGLRDAKTNWEKLHELLLCYLALNPKCAHGFIVRAFSDLLVSLMSSSENKSEDG